MAWFVIDLLRDTGALERLRVEANYYRGTNRVDDQPEWEIGKILDSEGEDVYPTISEPEADRIEELLDSQLSRFGIRS
jgi:hypothetical protein